MPNFLRCFPGPQFAVVFPQWMQRETKQLMDLPDNLLQKIAGNLNAESLHCFMRANRRLRFVVRNMEQLRIESRYLNLIIERLISLNSSNLRTLVLSNCHSGSPRMLAVIGSCPNLVELDVVNSGLKVEHLLYCLKSLRKLRRLSFTAFNEFLDDSFLSSYRNLERVYVECSHDSFSFVVELINRCVEIQRLHILVLNESFEWQRDQRAFPLRINHRRWNTLRTVILAFHRICCGREEIYNSVFGEGHDAGDVRFRNFAPDQDAFVYSCEGYGTEDRSIEVYEIPDLSSRMQRIRERKRDLVWRPRQLTVERLYAPSWEARMAYNLPPMPTDLVALNLRDCPSKVSVEDWQTLFHAFPCIESLSVPLCFLWTGCAEWNNTPGETSADSRSNDILMESLRMLKLKKLRLTEVCTLDFSPVPELPSLRRFEHLEELMMLDPPMSENFLKRISNPNIKTLRIRDRRRQLAALILESEAFLKNFNDLKYLKLDSPNLPLSSPVLWKALCKAELEQLCLVSESSDPICLDLMQNVLPELCRSLNVLHIHAPYLEKGASFRSMLEKEIWAMNCERDGHPLWPVILVDRYAKHLGHYMFIPNFPGRNLCCMDFKHEFDPIGWRIN